MIKNNNNNNNDDAGTSSLCYGHIGHSIETKVLWPAKISDKKVNLVNYKKKKKKKNLIQQRVKKTMNHIGLDLTFYR